MHVHNLSQLALSYTRHTDALNQTFVLLSSDYSKSLHLQTDRNLEFHTPGGLHYITRIPRYGRDLKYNKRTAEAIIPSAGVNEDGNGEVFRLNLEVGRFMKGFEVDVGGDDLTSLGGGALQGGIATGSVNCAAIAEESHGLMAFGTSIGTVEFWDARSRDRVSVLRPPSSISMLDTGQDEFRSAITALEFHPSGLNLATGSSNGLIHTYDLRSPIPLLRKDQGYDSPIQTLQYLDSTSRSTTSSSSNVAPNKLLSSDRKSIKLFSTDAVGEDNNNLWTSIQPSVDLNHVAWVPDSGMLLTANEGRQQHAFFIPQLGPAPKWCSFLDNLVEEMDTDANSGNPNAWKPSTGITNSNGVGDVYDNYKFVSNSELAALNLDHLVGDPKTNALRPYMHGFFVPQRLYEQARLLANPDLALEQRQKSIQAKIEKERESRIRGNKKVAVKVNRKLAEKLAAREEANERRKAARMLRKQGNADENDENAANMSEAEKETKPLKAASSAKAPKKARMDLMDDTRFRGLFEDEDFEIDEESREYQLHNPSSATTGGATKDVLKKSGLTAVEEEDLEDARRASSDDDGQSEESQDDVESARQRQRSRGAQRDDEDNAAKGRIGSASYKKSGHKSKQQRSENSQQKSGPRMSVSSSQQPSQKARLATQGKSFGDLASGLSSRERSSGDVSGVKGRGVVGEKEVSFVPAKKGGKKHMDNQTDGRDVRRPKGGSGRSGMGNRNEGRRSASGNVFRRM